MFMYVCGNYECGFETIDFDNEVTIKHSTERLAETEDCYLDYNGKLRCAHCHTELVYVGK